MGDGAIREGVRNLALAAWVAGVAGGHLLLPSAPRRMALAWLALAVAAPALVLTARFLTEAEAGRDLAVAVCVGLLAAGVAWSVARRHQPGAGTVDGYLGSRVRVEGRVASISASAGGGDRLRLEVTRLTASGDTRAVSGAVLADTTAPTALEVGDLVLATGRLAPLRAFGPSGQEGYDARLQRQGVFATLLAPTVEPLAPSAPGFGASLTRIRRSLIDAVTARFPEPEATVLDGLLIGARGHPPASIDRDLQDSGLIHLLAISGLKVVIVARCLEAALTRLVGRRGAALSLLGTAAYVAIAGGGASGTRAALMGGLATAGRALGRDTDPFRSLLLAATAMLAWSPSLCADLGFQFSFLGVLGIHLVGAPLIGVLPRALPAAFREAFGVSVGAQAMTLPLTARYFGVIPLLSPLANGLVVPLAPVTMLAGLAAVGAGAAGSSLGGSFLVLGSLSGALALVLIQLMLAVAHVTARLPPAVHVPGFAPAATAAYYAAIGLILSGRRLRWALPVSLGGAAALSLAILTLASRPDGRLHLSFLAVSGPSVLVRAPDGATLLVDGGSSASALPAALDQALPAGLPPPSLGRRLDAALLTGSTKPEAGAAAAVARYRLALVVIPAVDDGEAAAATAATAQAGGAQVVRLARGQALAWHGLSLSLVDAGPVDLLELDWAGLRVLVGAGGTTKAPAQPADGSYAVLDLGARAPSPLLTPPAAWLVIQDGAARGTGRIPAHPEAGRVWRTAVDGPLDLSCDRQRCEGPQ